MEYMSINQDAQEWDITPWRVQVLCEQDRIEGACRIGNMLAISKNAQKPNDARVKYGKYIKSKKKCDFYWTLFSIYWYSQNSNN